MFEDEYYYFNIKNKSVKKVLIIGADSFIANHFINYSKEKYTFKMVGRISSDEEDVLIVDDFFVLDHSYFTNIDVVINFAAIVHQPSNSDEALYKRVNYELPLYLAKKSIESGVRLFIQMSTIAVYGKVEIINRKTPYAATDYYGKYKLEADLELLKTYQDTSLSISILRPSMVYGGGQSPGNLLRLIKLTKTRLWLPFKGINNQRQFCNINLLINVLSFIIENNRTGVIILADKYPISTSKLITITNKLRGTNDRQFFFPLFWKLLKLINPELTDKLIGNLIVENTLNVNSLFPIGNIEIENGINEMI